MSITDQLEAERRIIDAAKRHCDLPLEFQQWGEQNQNGDDAESILFDANGESLAYGLPDEIGELAVLASTALPLRNAQVAAVLAVHEELVVYQMEDLETREFMTDENGEEIVLARVCRECSSEEVVDSIEDCEYQDGIYGEESYPCATVRAIEEAGE